MNAADIHRWLIRYALKNERPKHAVSCVTCDGGGTIREKEELKLCPNCRGYGYYNWKS